MLLCALRCPAGTRNAFSTQQRHEAYANEAYRPNPGAHHLVSRSAAIGRSCANRVVDRIDVGARKDNDGEDAQHGDSKAAVLGSARSGRSTIEDSAA